MTLLTHLLHRALGPILLVALLVTSLVPTADAGRKRRAQAPPPPAPTATAEGPSASSPELTSRIEALIADLRQPERRASARAGIKEIGQEATPFLLELLDDPDHQLRWEIANAQGDLRDPRAIQALVDYVLHDTNQHVRWRSMWALREYPDHAPAIELLRVGMDSEVELTRWNAAVGLSLFEDPSCLPIIHAGLSQQDEWRSWEAINALSRVHDETSLSHLGPLLPGSGDRFRREAAVTLGLMKGADAEVLLTRLLDDEDPQVRWRAAMSLGRIGGSASHEALRRRRMIEREQVVIEHLVQAMTRLSKKP